MSIRRYMQFLFSKVYLCIWDKRSKDSGVLIMEKFSILEELLYMSSCIAVGTNDNFLLSLSLSLSLFLFLSNSHRFSAHERLL